MQAIRSNFDFSFQGFGWFWVFGLMVYCFGKQKITLALLGDLSMSKDMQDWWWSNAGVAAKFPHLPWDHDP
jgi:hypothetical protein